MRFISATEAEALRAERWSSPPHAPGCTTVRGGRHPDDALEVAREVRLVAVAKLRGERRMIDAAGGQPRCRFVQPIALNDPLRADADIPCEQSLQRPLVHLETVDEVIDFGQGAVAGSRIDDG